MDKNFEIKKIVLGFILTTIVGSILTFVFKYAEYHYQHKQSLLESEKQKAEKCFDDISSSLDTRIYKMRKIFWAYKANKSKSEIDSLWKTYSTLVTEWNNNLNKNLSLIARYFGKEKRDNFEEIQTEFINSGTLLEAVRNEHSIDSARLETINNSFDILNPKLYFFDIGLQEQIEKEKVGVFK